MTLGLSRLARPTVFMLVRVQRDALPRCRRSLPYGRYRFFRDLAIENVEIAINSDEVLLQNIDLIGSKASKPNLLMPLCQRD
jgi:hypothetical protein